MRIKILFLLSFIIGWAVFHAGHAQAASTIAIEPTRIELALKPGQTATNKLRVSNRGKKPIYVEISTQAFSVVNEKYDYQFSEAEELSKWLKFNQTSAEIEPNKTLYRISNCCPQQRSARRSVSSGVCKCYRRRR